MNLDALQQGREDKMNHTLKVDSSKVMATDSIAIPTGNFINIDDTAYDFQVAREIGASWNETDEYCGRTVWILNMEQTFWNSGGHRDKPDSGAVYPLYWLNTPRKVIHSDPVLNRTKYSAVAIEQKGYIYAINTPEGHKSNGPGKDFSWSTTYRFSTVHYTPMHMRPGPSFWQVSGPFVFLEM
ncbi:hypothetical protein ACEPAI_3480 [Sanghuangporus weigelae]